MKRLTPILILLSILIASALLIGAAIPSKPDDVKGLTVHEWGTFTSIAGDDGRELQWMPWSGATDVPCFVDRFKGFRGKFSYSATVRMETPVLYFYAPKETTVNVGVRFGKGLITEWFPKASRVAPDSFMDSDLDKPGFAGAIRWDAVKVLPKAAEEFPVENNPNHYYAARQTDAAPLQVGTQKEKFLFYRGFADTTIPVSAMVEPDGKLLIRNLGGDAIPNVILFENRGGRLGYRTGGVVRDQVTLDPPSLNADFASLRGELEKALVAQGLYPKEARAMIETWRDSWFEEGARLIYILPQKAVNAMLPLEITPAPIEISRVFVGRVELMTKTTRETIKTAIEHNDRATLEKYGRFLQPISNRILGESNTLVNTIASDYLARQSAVCK